MKHVLMFVAAIVAAIAFGPVSAVGQESTVHHAIPDILGNWTGRADFLLPEGEVRQLHTFVFEQQDGVLLRGTHIWSTPDASIPSHDGNEHVFEAEEPFLAVIDFANVIRLVEHGDFTLFELRLVNRITMDFIATEGGDFPIVGHGVVVRE